VALGARPADVVSMLASNGLGTSLLSPA
jgi:hypothetical protein